jgi:hypothetical protein
VDVENMSNGSTVEALWALGALEPKKRLKRPDLRVGLWWKRCRKHPPRGAVLCHLFTGTEIYAVRNCGVINRGNFGGTVNTKQFHSLCSGPLKISPSSMPHSYYLPP